MRLSIRLFAVLRERAGAPELVLDDCPEGISLGDLKRLLEERYPALGSLGHVRGVVGTEYVGDQQRLAAGQELALLPPVSGGSGAPRTGDDAAADAALERGHFELSAEPIDPGLLARRVEHPGCGAVVTFAGNVRDNARGQAVARLEYEAFEAMTEPEMARIFADCVRAHGDPEGIRPERRLRMLCVHRVGAVGVGEPSVVIAVASPHRATAFDAARFLIDELKARLPVWKKEVYADGHHWVGERS